MICKTCGAAISAQDEVCAACGEPVRHGGGEGFWDLLEGPLDPMDPEAVLRRADGEEPVHEAAQRPAGLRMYALAAATLALVAALALIIWGVRVAGALGQQSDAIVAELEATIAQQEETIALQRDTIEQLKGRIAELEAGDPANAPQLDEGGTDLPEDVEAVEIFDDSPGPYDPYPFEPGHEEGGE